ncbi:MAG: cation:proton antiporter [Chthoniobacter sp.]|nr:cation:proton antiporter [Chthoniobacter sp.]
MPLSAGTTSGAARWLCSMWCRSLVRRATRRGVRSAGHFAPSIREGAERLLSQVEFGNAPTQGMLCFLLFAGALHIDLNDLADHRGVVATLAVVDVVISMFVFGTLIHFALGWLGF